MNFAKHLAMVLACSFVAAMQLRCQVQSHETTLTTSTAVDQSATPATLGVRYEMVVIVSFPSSLASGTGTDNMSWCTTEDNHVSVLVQWHVLQCADVLLRVC